MRQLSQYCFSSISFCILDYSGEYYEEEKNFRKPWKGKDIMIYSVLERNRGFPGGTSGREPTCNAGDRGSIPGSGRSPGGQHGSPLQHSCLENPMDSGAWQATGHWVSKSQSTTEATLRAGMDQNEPLKTAWANSSFYWEEIARWSQD